MTLTKEEQLEALIDNAIKKVQATKENDICRYLPGVEGGYIHHFTFTKMKKEDPKEVISLLEKYILKPNKPEKLPHKPRAPRGSRKRLELLNFTKSDMDRLLQMVRVHGDKEMIRKLSPARDLKTLKKDLINSIKSDEVDFELWNTYVEQMQARSHADDMLALNGQGYAGLN